MKKLSNLIAQASDNLSVRRVYGKPYEQGGVTLIPAAAVRGGWGGGEGERGGEEGGSGGGFGVIARPVGAFEISGETVSWVPAADTTRVIVMAEVLGIVALLVYRSVAAARRS